MGGYSALCQVASHTCLASRNYFLPGHKHPALISPTFRIRITISWRADGRWVGGE